MHPTFRRNTASFSSVGIRLLIVFFAFEMVAFPAAVPTSFVIDDGGYPRTFDLALDELVVSGPAGHRLIAFPAPAQSRIELQQRAGQQRLNAGERIDFTLYERSSVADDASRRILTRRVLVRLPRDVDRPSLAASVGAHGLEIPDGAPDYIILIAPPYPGAALDFAETLRAHPDVLTADPMLEKRRAKRFLLNDPLVPQQWHLRNTGQGGGTPGIDVRITNVWAQGYFGANVVIGIVDDGLQYTHPDLAPNYVAAYSRNWNGLPGGPFDPAPSLFIDDHGTACAGVAAARGNNNLGVSGAAPQASLAGLRLISGSVGDSQEAESVAYSNQQIIVKSNSWGPNDTGNNLEAPGPLTRAALSNSTVTGRSGRGTIHVWAGGNGRANNDNANYDGYANSIYTLSVAAITDSGAQSWYSEPGACHVITAPSSGGSTDIITTDLLGNNGYNFTGASGELSDRDYTKTFGGTSSSTPLVAGIVALMLDARPTLGWRDVQEIFIRTARQINPGDSLWRTNSAGFTFNPKFGAGLVDANAAVQTALTWTNLGPQVLVVSNRPSLGLAIPDNNANGVSASFTLSTNVRVEHVTVTLNISHSRRGQLEIFLTSPHGTISQLAAVRTDNNAHPSSWTYMTVHKWGETSQGIWTLRVADRTSGTSGTLNGALLTLFGTSATPLTGQPPSLNPIAPPTIAISNQLAFTVTASDPVDGDVITLLASNLPPWASFATSVGTGTVSQTFSGTPTATGTWITTFHAFDNDGFDRAPVTIAVIPPPPKTPPILSPIGDAAIVAENLLTFPVTAQPTDGDPVTLSVINAPPGSTFVATNQNGTFSWTPGGNDLGTYPVTFTATDLDGTTSETITITVLPSPNNPVATNQLVLYTFDLPGGIFTTQPEQTASSLTASPFTTDNGVFADITGNPGRAITASQWTSPTRQYEFSVTIPPGHQLVVGGFSFEHRRSSTGPLTWTLRHSADQFASALGTGSSDVTFSSNAVPLALSGLTGTVTFAIQGSNATGIIGTWRLDNVRLFGQLSLISTNNMPPQLFTSGNRTVVMGTPLDLRIIALDPYDLDPVTLSADPLPLWASFPTVTGSGGVTSSLVATFPWPGFYTITVRASDKDGTTSESFSIDVTAPPATLLQSSLTTGLPSGWTVRTNGHPAAFWRFDDPDAIGNLTGGNGTYALADSDHAGSVNMDTELRTPAFSLNGQGSATLSFRTDLRIYTGNEIADVDVSANGEAGPWINLWRRQVDVRGPILITLDLAPALGSTNAMVRFRYHNANYDWWWQVDDVNISGALQSGYTDTDGDGIPDQWELLYFGNLNTANVTSDFSGNGFLDSHAFISGTDPTDPGAALDIDTHQTLPSGGMQITWPSASNRLYRVGRATQLPHFTPIVSGIPATPPQNIYHDPTATNSAAYFYRIEVEANSAW